MNKNRNKWPFEEIEKHCEALSGYSRQLHHCKISLSRQQYCKSVGFRQMDAGCAD